MEKEMIEKLIDTAIKQLDFPILPIPALMWAQHC